jgi:hypothetical protein
MDQLNELATDLLSIFAGFFRNQQSQLRFEKPKIQTAISP